MQTLQTNSGLSKEDKLNSVLNDYKAKAIDKKIEINTETINGESHVTLMSVSNSLKKFLLTSILI